MRRIMVTAAILVAAIGALHAEGRPQSPLIGEIGHLVYGGSGPTIIACVDPEGFDDPAAGRCAPLIYIEAPSSSATSTAGATCPASAGRPGCKSG
jgi:hypothetical protein